MPPTVVFSVVPPRPPAVPTTRVKYTVAEPQEKRSVREASAKGLRLVSFLLTTTVGPTIAVPVIAEVNR